MARRTKSRTITRYVRRPASRRRYSNGGAKFSIAILAGLAPLFMEGVNGFKSSGLTGIMHNLAFATTGYEWVAKRWDFNYAFRTTYLPMLLGFMIHWVANKVGINRSLRLPMGIGV